MINHRTAKQTGIEVAAGILKCSFGPKITFFTPYRDKESLRRFKFAAIGRGSNTAVRSTYPQLHSNRTLRSIRQILNNRP